MKKKLLLMAIALVVAYFGAAERGIVPGPVSNPTGNTGPADAALSDAIEQRRSNVQVLGSGVVKRVLADDNDGSRHQRFILTLASGRTLLIVHNIDLAPRVEGIQAGDHVAFHGEYEWTEQGGVVHWTHHDPQGHHVAGWLKHDGRIYQ